MRTERRRKAASLALLAVLATAPPLLAGHASAEMVLAEDWESGLGAWSITGTGMSQDCSVGQPGCSLRVHPVCCNSYVRATDVLGVPMRGTTEVSFHFHADSTRGDTDSALIVDLTNGGRLSLILNHGVSPNNGVSLLSAGFAGSEFFTRWTSANTWYKFVVRIDPAANSARAEMRDANGALLGSSGTVGIPATSNAIDHLQIEGVFWGGGRNVFHFDTVRLSDLAPNPPRDLTATGDVRSAKLAWKAPEEVGGEPATGYRVYRDGKLVATTGNVLSYTDTGLGNAATYTYTVRAVNAYGASGPSGEATATTFGFPSEPLGLAAQGGVRQANLTWFPPASDGGAPVIGYKVYRDGALVGSVGDATAYTDTGLGNGATYAYEVSAVTAVGEGARSAAATATTFDFPSEPLNLTAAPSQTLRAVQLAWKAPDSDGGVRVTNYRVYRLEDDGSWRQVAEVTARLYADRDLVPFKTYHYRVTAVNAVGEGPASREACSVPSPWVPEYVLKRCQGLL